MKKSLAKWVAVTIVSFSFLSTVAQAQEWSAAQKAIWENVQAYWKADTSKDLDGFLSYFDDDYVGWSVSDPLPTTKENLRKWIKNDYETETTVVYEIKPVAIKIHGDVAFVHYYYSRIVKDQQGKQKPEGGRWTDILKKKGEKWVLIGDHGGRTSKESSQ